MAEHESPNAPHGILPALAALAVPIDAVRLNPANTRKHEKRSLDGDGRTFSKIAEERESKTSPCKAEVLA